MISLIVVVFIIFRKEILSFFMPDQYLMVLIREKDGNIAKFIIKRNETMTFQFQKGIYNLYDGYTDESTETKSEEVKSNE